MRRTLPFVVCSVLASLPSLGAWAGPASGRPSLAPVALEARCPLADGTWDLDATLSRLSACPAESGSAGTIPAAPPVDGRDAAPAADAPEQDAPEQSVAEAKPADRDAAGKDEATMQKLSPAPKVVRGRGWNEEYLPYDLMPTDRFRLQLFPLELPRLNYLPLAPVAGLKPQPITVAGPATESLQPHPAAKPAEEETPSAALASSDGNASQEPAETASPEVAPEEAGHRGASDLVANADCILDDWLWRAGEYLEGAQFSWQQAVRQGGRRVAAGLSPATALATRALVALPVAAPAAEGLAQQETEAILLSSPRGLAFDAEQPSLAAKLPASLEEAPAEAVLVGPPAPPQLAQPSQTPAPASSMLATAESLKAAGALLRQLGEGLERLAIRQASAEAAARRF